MIAPPSALAAALGAKIEHNWYLLKSRPTHFGDRKHYPKGKHSPPNNTRVLIDTEEANEQKRIIEP